jgi:hypothetical protein
MSRLKDGAHSSVYDVPCSKQKGENTRTRQGMKLGDLLTFLTLTIGLTLGLGATMAAAYRVDVARNWEDRRCDPGVAAMAGFFKPSTDPRSATQFARDNWSFCQKEYVQDGIRAAAAIPKGLAEAEGAVVEVVRDIVSTVADVFFSTWNVVNEAYSTFMDRMKVVAKLMHNFMIQLHSIVERLQASILALVFGLMSLVKAFISTVQVVLIVAIVIIGILIALQIILFFLLLPISGLIITVSAIVSVVAVVISTAIAAAMVAELYTPGACFAGGTQILLGRGGGRSPIEAVRIGAVLVDGGVVTAVHRFYQAEQFYEIDGVRVTGDHLIQSNERGSELIRVRDHSDASLDTACGVTPQSLWCLTTTTRRIPVQGRSSAHLFADWEEIPETDEGAQRAWHAQVWRALNPGQPLIPPRSTELAAEAGIAPDCRLPVASWIGRRQLRRAMDVRIGDWLYTREGRLTRVLGIVELAGDQVTDAISLRDPALMGEMQIVSVGSWVRAVTDTQWHHPRDPKVELHPVRWLHFYTAAGEFQIGRGAWTLRDASDVGLAQIGTLVDDVILPPVGNFGIIGR